MTIASTVILLLLGASPPPADALAQALGLLGVKKCDDAFALLAQIHPSSPPTAKEARAARDLANGAAACRAADPIVALGFSTLAARLAPSDADVLLEHAVGLLAADQRADAASTLDHLMELRTAAQMPRAWLLRGKLASDEGDHAIAVKALAPLMSDAAMRPEAAPLLAASKAALDKHDLESPARTSPHPDASAEARQAGTRLEALLATLPIPTELPLVGPAGVDGDGYPRRNPDRIGLRTLLVHGRFADLTRYFEAYQVQFELDYRYEHWLVEAVSAFDTKEPEMDDLLDAWVAFSPRSFAPYLVRGAHRVTRGFVKRGGKLASETPDENFRGMDEAFVEASADLERALELLPKLMAAHLWLLTISMAQSGDSHAIYERAVASCPNCFLPRAAYMKSLVPKWGGSFEEMAAVAIEAGTLPNPRLRFLPGYVHWHRSILFLENNDPRGALKAIEEACAVGEFWPFILKRAKINRELARLQVARIDIERANSLRPGEPSILFERSLILARQRLWEPAGVDLLAALRMDYRVHAADWLIDFVLPDLVREAVKCQQAGDKSTARRMIDLAATISPSNQAVQRAKAMMEPPPVQH
jgi:tetratricopeptide (TPR) repeat protein